MNIIILSSLAQNTGCHLRAQYMAQALGKVATVRYFKPFPKSLPLMLDMVLSVPVNVFRVLFSQADVYIGVKPFPNVTLPLIIKKIVARKKIVLDIDDMDSGYRGGLAAVVISLSQRPFPRFFDLITYHNENLAQCIQQAFAVPENRLYQLDQGVNLSVFHPGEPDRKLRSRFPEDKKIVLYAGHLNVASDLDEVMRAMKIVLSRVPATFIVAGGGVDEGRFRKRAEKIGLPVVFTGPLSNEQVATYISIADICLAYYRDTPANRYRASMKLREYLAMGKKVVANNVGELGEFRAFTCQSSTDIEAYANEIIRALTLATDHRETAASEHVRRRYDWDDLGRRLHERLGVLLLPSPPADVAQVERDVPPDRLGQ